MRLRKFNENKSEIDYDYIHDCFADLIDDGNIEIELMSYEKITIRLSAKPIITKSLLESIKDTKLYDYIEAKNNENELLQRVKLSLKRLESKHPNYFLKFKDYGGSVFIEIYSEKEEENYPF